MVTQADRFSQFFEKRRGPRNFDDEAALLLAAKAFDRIKEQGKVTAVNLGVIVNAAYHPRAMQWDGASELLGMLAIEFEEAAPAVIDMSRHK